MESDNGGRARTYGIWGVVGLFIVLAVAGLVAFVVVGNPVGQTSNVPTSQTLPGGEEIELGEGGDSSPVTMPGGAPAPEGVSEVLVDGDTTAFSLEVPSGVDLDSMDPVVAPASVAAVSGGEELRVSVECAESSEELVAQVGVTEGSQAVTVIAVVLVPDDARPCDEGADPVELQVPLASPLADRAIVVVPAGTAVPGLSAG